MIPKSGIRFSEKIMPRKIMGDELDTAKLDQALGDALAVIQRVSWLSSGNG
jgi:hypothetical protein